jgi:hypothetical protein
MGRQVVEVSPKRGECIKNAGKWGIPLHKTVLS